MDSPTLLDTLPNTLPDALVRAAERFPQRGIAIFDRRGKTAERLTYPEFLSLARRGAAKLAARGVRPKDPVLVSLQTSWPWFEAWFGALLLGAWPVAVAPSGALGSSEAQAERVDQLIERMAAKLLVCTAAFRADAEAHGAQLIRTRSITLEELAEQTVGSTPHPPPTEPDDVAYLQLTSGSTGFPRGVIVTHRNAIHNSWANSIAIGAPHGAPAHAWADCMVSWLPLYHDMGLVGCVLLPIFCGFDLWLLAPRAFLAKPALWMQHVGQHGKCLSPAPNFGYQLCVERIADAEVAPLDLADFSAALVGAEMVRPDTMDAFTRKFGPRGFRNTALRPCYGLAEGTLAVTFDLRGEGPRTRRVPSHDPDLELNEVVTVGAPIEDTELRITAPDGAVMPDGTIGEIRAKGPGIFTGYYDDPAATAESLEDGWLKTGDLGFVAGGELHITGRTKDLLIVRGHNIMPHELEWVADAVTAGGGATRSGAFSVSRGAHGEEAVLVLETDDRDPAHLAALAHEVRVRIGRTIGLPLADVAFVRRGHIPKTTSGKVQRRELRRAYLAGELERIAVPPPPEPGDSH